MKITSVLLKTYHPMQPNLQEYSEHLCF